jgi:hypothetical protein
MAAAIRKGDGCLCSPLDDDCQGLQHRFTDVDPHLRLIERFAKPRRVSFGAAFALGLHFQSNPGPRGDDISAALIWLALDTIFQPFAARCSQSRLTTASSVSTFASKSAATI